MSLLKNFALLNSTGTTQHLVAFSGGMDSSVLLHLAVRAELKGLAAIHVHHGLQAVADDWLAHCTKVCEALHVPLIIEHVVIDPNDASGPEASARKARYDAMAKHLEAGGVLLTAHHQQDQAETVLLRLLRGTGVEGIAAMRQQKPFAMGTLQRPLLQVPKTEIAAYANAHQLHWINDPHNVAQRYARSWLRSQILPQIRERIPAVDALLSRAAQHAEDATSILSEVAAQDAETVALANGALCIHKLLTLSPARRHAAIRHWLNLKQIPQPFSASFHCLERDIFTAKIDATPLLSWPGGEFRRYRNQLYAYNTLAPAPHDWQTQWDGTQPLQLPADCGTLRCANTPLTAPLQVQFARGGERIIKAGNSQHSSIKKLMQEASLPPWLRTRIPLIYQAGELVSVGGLWHAQDAPALSWRSPHMPIALHTKAASPERRQTDRRSNDRRQGDRRSVNHPSSE